MQNSTCRFVSCFLFHVAYLFMTRLVLSAVMVYEIRAAIICRIIVYFIPHRNTIFMKENELSVSLWWGTWTNYGRAFGLVSHLDLVLHGRDCCVWEVKLVRRSQHWPQNLCSNNFWGAWRLFDPPKSPKHFPRFTITTGIMSLCVNPSEVQVLLLCTDQLINSEVVTYLTGKGQGERLARLHGTNELPIHWRNILRAVWSAAV